MLGSAEMVAVNEQRFFTVERGENGLESFGTVANEFGGDVGFEVVEFLINGGKRNRHIVLVNQVGILQRRRTFERDIEHERQERGKKEGAFVPTFCAVVEKPGELLGGQRFGRSDDLPEQNHHRHDP